MEKWAGMEGNIMEACGGPNLENETFRNFDIPRLHLKQDNKRQARVRAGVRAASAWNLAALLRSRVCGHSTVLSLALHISLAQLQFPTRPGDSGELEVHTGVTHR